MNAKRNAIPRLGSTVRCSSREQRPILAVEQQTILRLPLLHHWPNVNLIRETSPGLRMHVPVRLRDIVRSDSSIRIPILEHLLRFWDIDHLLTNQNQRTVTKHHFAACEETQLRCD